MQTTQKTVVDLAKLIVQKKVRKKEKETKENCISKPYVRLRKISSGGQQPTRSKMKAKQRDIKVLCAPTNLRINTILDDL